MSLDQSIGFIDEDELVEITPMPKPSESTVTTKVNKASNDRKIKTEGLRATKEFCMVQSPAARPLRAMMPRGRNWMKMMMKMIM